MEDRTIQTIKCPVFVLLALWLFALLSSGYAWSGDRYITLNDAKHIRLSEPIGKVFISNPDVADYKVMNDNTVVVFANGIGQARLLVYGVSETVLLSDRIVVDLNLSQVRRQIDLYYPQLDIKLESVGPQVAVSGVVESEEQRDDIYRMVATLLGREKVERWNEIQTLEFESETLSVSEPESMIFARNMTWEGIIERLEVAGTRQVNVKVSIAQVTESFGETIGVDWSSVGSNVGEFVFNQFEAEDLVSVISAIGNDSVAQVLAEPNLSVMSGESASFLVGGEVPVIVSTNSNVNITFKEFGIRLDLTAKVESDDRIRMQLFPEVSEIDGYVTAAGIEVPKLASRRAMTTVELGDGDSFILGGLMSSADYEEMQKTPLLGDIPIIGAAFRKAITERRKTELIIVATVNLVKPIRSTEIQMPYIHKTNTLTRWLNIEVDDHQAPQSDATIRLLSEGGFIQ